MEYTVQKLAKLAKVSTRTLRYYDEIKILTPARINSSGYRIYGEKEVDCLQQILFYREMGLELSAIKEILQSKEFDEEKALDKHLTSLLAKRQQLDLLIENVKKTINNKKGMIQMSDKEKFEGFMQELVEQNEEKYGEEIRKKYTDEVIDESNQQMLQMTKEQYEEFKRLEQEILDTLEVAFETKDAAGELAQQVAELHKKWLGFTWKKYSKEAHEGLAQMYVEDERFRAYYDKKKAGMAEFLRDAIFYYTGKKTNK